MQFHFGAGRRRCLTLCYGAPGGGSKSRSDHRANNVIRSARRLEMDSAIRVPFTVNDEPLRRDFLQEHMITALERLSPTSRAQWGKMTPQQMVEHLIWALEVSNGLLEAHCNLNAKLVAKIRGFLFDNTPTSHEFMNPMLKQGFPANRFSSIREAIDALRNQVRMFNERPPSEWNQLRTHPIFGPLNQDEWSRSHFKHCYHHLLQFGLIESMETN